MCSCNSPQNFFKLADGVAPFPLQHIVPQKYNIRAQGLIKAIISKYPNKIALLQMV